MPVKRLNFTNRVKLTREQANILIYPTEPATFEAVLDLSHLPEHAANARVFVEAYHRTTRMRFDFGTVRQITTPIDRQLLEFDDWKSISFRVKVTDMTESPGRIVAWANNIHPKSPDDQPENDLVRWKDAELDGRLWDMDFDEKGPYVLVEKQIGHANVGTDALFIATAYPEILRRTLQEALLNARVAEDDPEHWFSTWYTGYFGSRFHLPKVPDAHDQEARRQWIENTVNAFARQFRIADYWITGKGRKGAE